MKYFKLSLFIILIALSYYGCTPCHNNVIYTSKFVESFLDTYNFELKDSLGEKILEGTIQPKIFADPEISGIYNITKYYKNDYNSLLGSTAKFSGNLDEKSKKGFINLNPKLADNNIFLRFDVKTNDLTGTWENSTMAGIRAKGEFTATKKK